MSDFNGCLETFVVASATNDAPSIVRACDALDAYLDSSARSTDEQSIALTKISAAFENLKLDSQVAGAIRADIASRITALSTPIWTLKIDDAP